jgi:NAD-dependent deacetylase
LSSERLPLDHLTSVLVLTGAGVSAESGIPTFRAAGGLWESHPVEQVASPGGFAQDPALVWRFYSERRRKASVCAPNPGHLALAPHEARLGHPVHLANLVELHGNLFLTRCSECSLPPFADEAEHLGPALPTCSACASKGRTSLLRPHIVWFGEMLDPGHLMRVERFMTSAKRLVFLAVGTSGAVWPAAGLVGAARARGASTWLVNAEPAENTSLFEHFVQGPSGAVLPALLGPA